MWESLSNIFINGDVWSIIIKALLSLAATGLCGLIGTLIGKVISNHKTSKIYKYARTVVDAAEQKFPNEGKKMGPEKMQYVMDQLVIKFPKIADNRYLYNIAEQAVYKLNEEKRKEELVIEFKKKYGEDPIGVSTDINKDKAPTSSDINSSTVQASTSNSTSTSKKRNRLQSF